MLVDLPPGALLLLYTDGLVERRGQTLDTGIASLTSHVRAGDPETVCTDVMSEVGPGLPTDDITVLAVQRWP
ncbi:SpoIIE family protein phosphatase [Paractinoplanes hotanensis]|uniref:SpoIIE family protein phosphatase n=1 Tax=Paractinoplanes hotanensis TaxID=2906497 RepID=UPI0027E39D6A|nr:SpoIIE family protein phosphatase [Actinoplanes hotanensis]